MIATDVTVVIILGVVAWLIRHTGLPHNGLWHDDAWVATGAIYGHPWQIFMVGSGHPGFTSLLMLVSRATGASSSAFAYPAFAAGILAPPLLYLALVRFGYARSISARSARPRSSSPTSTSCTRRASRPTPWTSSSSWV